ncbi:hypothetical protein V8C34DRAFT_297091 [Trichoderma compactum]
MHQVAPHHTPLLVSSRPPNQGCSSTTIARIRATNHPSRAWRITPNGPISSLTFSPSASPTPSTPFLPSSRLPICSGTWH